MDTELIESDIYDLACTSLQVRKELADYDITFFGDYYLSHHFREETGGVSEIHEEWLNLATDYPYIILAAPRDHAKSTTFSLCYVLHQILFEQKKFIILISDTKAQAQELLGTIIEELETNERIIRDFGKIAGDVPENKKDKKKWTASEIETTTKIKVIARGWKSKLRGLRYGAYRPDLILVDDIENDENVESPEQREKVKKVFFKSILNLGNEAQKVIIGTILHFDSLLSNLLQQPPSGAYTRLYRAIGEDGLPVWKQRWSLKKLQAKKEEIGSINFEQEFMNNPLDETQQILKPNVFFDSFEDLKYNSIDTIGFIDLAISEKQTADYTAICIGKKVIEDGRKKIKIVDCIKFRGDVHKQLEEVFRLHEIYKFDMFGVESVAYQKAFYQLLINESMKRKVVLPVTPRTVDVDKIRKAKRLSVYFENGTVEFNRNLQRTLLEVRQFPKSAHDDEVDAVLGVVDLAITGGSVEVNSFNRQNPYEANNTYEGSGGVVIQGFQKKFSKR